MLTLLSVNISDTAIITLKDVDYSCIIHDISKSEAINLLKISVLDDRGCSKFEKSIALTKKLREELMPVAWHLKNFSCQKMRKKKKNQFLLRNTFSARQ